jgi:spore coat protein U-like protein
MTSSIMSQTHYCKLRGPVGCFFLLLSTMPFVAYGSANAGSATAALGVSVTVARSCNLSTTPLAYDRYDPTEENATSGLETRATLTIGCTQGSDVTIAFGAGLNGRWVTTTQAMFGGGDKPSYEIYKDSALTQVWTDSGEGLLNMGKTASHLPQEVPVRGWIPAGQDIPNGAYTDTVTVTVNF